MKTARLLEELGHTVVEADAPVSETFPDDFLLYWAMTAMFLIRTGRRAHGRTFDKSRHDNLTLGLVAHATRNLHRIPGAIRRLKRTHARLGGLLRAATTMRCSPTLATRPPAIGHLAPTQDYDTIMDRLLDWVAFTPLLTATGDPAISLPLATTAGGLPQGMMLAAGAGREAMLLELAYELEEAVAVRDDHRRHDHDAEVHPRARRRSPALPPLAYRRQLCRLPAAVAAPRSDCSTSAAGPARSPPTWPSASRPVVTAVERWPALDLGRAVAPAASRSRSGWATRTRSSFPTTASTWSRPPGAAARRRPRQCCARWAGSAGRVASSPRATRLRRLHLGAAARRRSIDGSISTGAARANSGEPDAGRGLLGWAHAAGWTSPRPPPGASPTPGGPPSGGARGRTGWGPDRRWPTGRSRWAWRTTPTWTRWPTPGVPGPPRRRRLVLHGARRDRGRLPDRSDRAALTAEIGCREPISESSIPLCIVLRRCPFSSVGRASPW